MLGELEISSQTDQHIDLDNVLDDDYRTLASASPARDIRLSHERGRLWLAQERALGERSVLNWLRTHAPRQRASLWVFAITSQTSGCLPQGHPHPQGTKGGGPGTLPIRITEDAFCRGVDRLFIGTVTSNSGKRAIDTSLGTLPVKDVRLRVELPIHGPADTEYTLTATALTDFPYSVGSRHLLAIAEHQGASEVMGDRAVWYRHSVNDEAQLPEQGSVEGVWDEHCVDDGLVTGKTEPWLAELGPEFREWCAHY